MMSSSDIRHMYDGFQLSPPRIDNVARSGAYLEGGGQNGAPP